MNNPIDTRFNAGLGFANRILWILIRCEDARFEDNFNKWYKNLGILQTIISSKYNKIEKDRDKILESERNLRKGMELYARYKTYKNKDDLFKLMVAHEEILRGLVDKYGLGMVEEASMKGAVR